MDWKNCCLWVAERAIYIYVCRFLLRLEASVDRPTTTRLLSMCVPDTEHGITRNHPLSASRKHGLISPQADERRGTVSKKHK